MAVGSSGRIVIEIDPELKAKLHQVLSKEGVSLKQWFIENVTEFLGQQTQPELPFLQDRASLREGGK